MDPAWRTPWEKLAFLFLAKGELERSFAYWDRIRVAVNQPGTGVTGYIIVLALLGRKGDATPYFEQLIRRAIDDPDISLDSDLATCYAALGDLDKAFYYLNACYESKAGSIMYALRYPLNMLFIKDERYWQMLDRIGLRKYYEEEKSL